MNDLTIFPEKIQRIFPDNDCGSALIQNIAVHLLNLYLISEKMIIPAKMTAIKAYCSTDNLSLRMILDSMKDMIT
mgnify:CR=1 FL=1